MKRWQKILLWVGGIAVALLLAAWLGLKGFLASPYARQTAATQLSDSLGLPVEIDSLDVGANSTTVALHIPDKDSPTPADLLKVKSVSTDISLGGLASGKAAPTALTANGAELFLRMDEKGQFLSPLPKPKADGKPSAPLPAVHLVGARVRIQQVGRPEFELGGLNGDLARDGDGYAITGTVDDPKWGKWTIGGRLSSDPTDGSVELASDSAGLHDDLLRSIPFIPREVWDHIGASGNTAASVAFTFKPNTLNYAVTLHPQAATLNLPDAGVAAQKVQGAIVIADNMLTVTDGTLTLMDGPVKLSGVYDFTQAVQTIDGKFSGEGVDVKRLPTSWGLPKDIEGRLRANADLHLKIQPDGKVETSGEGKGDVVGAKWKGFDAEVKLNLTSRNGRFRFEQIEPPAEK